MIKTHLIKLESNQPYFMTELNCADENLHNRRTVGEDEAPVTLSHINSAAAAVIKMGDHIRLKSQTTEVHKIQDLMYYTTSNVWYSNFEK